MPTQIIVVIPAKNEAERLGGALRALDAASAYVTSPVMAFVLANNCTDQTVCAAHDVARQLEHCRLQVLEVVLPAALAHAGGARRAAVAQGMQCYSAQSNDIIVSTDADARFRRDAFRKIAEAVGAGDDLVLAKIECTTDPWDPVPEDALSWGRPGVVWRHCVRRFVETVRCGRVAPPHFHDDYGGAGIAVRVGAYLELGGFAAIPSNEDLALVRAADVTNMRVNRHSGAIVDVLARAQGRAQGGMAAALANCLSSAARRLPCLVEHHAVTVRRILRNPSHANAFSPFIEEWEPAEEAIAGLELAISAFGEPA